MNILIVDDETLARERLERLVLRIRPDVECYQASSAEAALETLAELDVQLVLLDVRMSGMGGIALAAQLAELPEPPAVIFCTAYDEYALEALRQQAIAYLLKPIREADLAAALQRAGRINRVQLAALQGRDPESPYRTHVSSNGHRGVEVMAVVDIRCFLAEQKYVTAYAPGRHLLLPESLKELEQEFGSSFVRVHRNALVAVHHVKRLARDADGGWCVELRDIDLRPVVSRRHLSAVKELLLGR